MKTHTRAVPVEVLPPPPNYVITLEVTERERELLRSYFGNLSGVDMANAVNFNRSRRIAWAPVSADTTGRECVHVVNELLCAFEKPK